MEDGRTGTGLQRRTDTFYQYLESSQINPAIIPSVDLQFICSTDYQALQTCLLYCNLNEISVIGQIKFQRSPGKYFSVLFYVIDNWIANSVDFCAAFLLADAGYDVWMGNLRGSAYSRKHRTWSPENSKFWDFSMDEYAIKDLPAMMDYILDATNRSSLSYIGISLGTTISTILLSNRTDYNSKLNLVVHLAPVTFFKTPNLARKILSIAADLLEGPFKAFEILPRNRLIYSFVELVCLANSAMLEFCLFFVDTIVGKDREQLDMPPNFLLKIAQLYPAGCSAKVFFHYFQFIRTGEFGYFDHKNDKTNLRYYGQTKAPAYNLTNIVAPMAFFKAPNDPLSTLEDDLALISKLPVNRTLYYEIVRWKNFNHIDFIVAKDVKKFVYNRLFEILSDINKFP
ncbi:gastric triacylglycerol lipase-like isoform X1 [Diachasmimorpha longicaudata]|uniref:gastric triacylglycerol lipase-like isoform X1 n=1 Tax=Diachasmimorpha longicaudata TaxID=58733 RepID=UPI0030B8DDB9